MKKEKVYLFMSCNEKWIPHLVVAINSAKFNTSRHIHLFFCLKDKNREFFFRKILESLLAYNFSFEILIPEKSHLKLLTGFKFTNFPIECYYRLVIGSLVPSNIKKIIYLDCDIIINGDLSILYDMPINTTIAASEDIYGSFHCSKLLFQNFGVRVQKYINNGVMLIDLDKYRNNKKEDEIFNILSKITVNYLPKTIDQDLFNLVFMNDVTFLEISWNTQILYGVIPKNIHRIHIYHVYGYLKANSPLFYNRTLHKMYCSYSINSKSPKMIHHIIYFFIMFPLKKFLYVRAKLYFRWNFSFKRDFPSILWLFYPPVTFIILIQVFNSIKKIGLKNFIKKFLQLLGIAKFVIL